MEENYKFNKEELAYVIDKITKEKTSAIGKEVSIETRCYVIGWCYRELTDLMPELYRNAATSKNLDTHMHSFESLKMLIMNTWKRVNSRILNDSSQEKLLAVALAACSDNEGNKFKENYKFFVDAGYCLKDKKLM